jgi:hypothetical protein
MKKLFNASALAFMALPFILNAQIKSGIWDGTIKYDQLSIPFKFEIAGQGDQIRGSFFNGDVPIGSTGGRLAGNQLSLNFDHLGSKLEATVDGDSIRGTFGG